MHYYKGLQGKAFSQEVLKNAGRPHHWTPLNMANQLFRPLAGPILRPNHAQHVHTS